MSVINSLIQKAGLWTPDGVNLEFFRNGGIRLFGNRRHDAIYNIHTTAKWPIGTRWQLGDRTFYFGLANGDLPAGNLVQTAALGGATTVQRDCTVALAGAVGARVVTITIKTDTLVANQFRNGLLIVSDGSPAQGVGQSFRIKSHPAGADDVIFTLYDKIPVIINSTGGKVTIMANKYYKLIAAPATTASGAPAGVPLVKVLDTYYGWFQTWGPCGVLSSSATITIGHGAVVALSTGAVKNQVGTAEDECLVGDILLAGDTSSADHVLIDLKLAA